MNLSNLNFYTREAYLCRNSQELTLRGTDKDGEECEIRLTHFQDCCEHVRCMEDKLATDPDSLRGMITDINRELWVDETPMCCEDVKPDDFNDSYTWTVFTVKFVTGKTRLVRFLGESNGYYCEEAEAVVKSITPYEGIGDQKMDE